LSLKLLLDECLLDKSLVSKLRNAGHDVITASEVGLIRKRDEVIFQYAIDQQRIVLTTNCDDFIILAGTATTTQNSYPGILLVYRYNNPNKDMSNEQIVTAINNLEKTSAVISSNCYSLNRYNW